ncbi:MAG: FeoA family protein [Candidatus Marinimicrobia bacterium]|jgi:ferrous iron transport protein A|nr:FeoA family protein [Candidatus Neomarinimicrobiota bacterium]
MSLKEIQIGDKAKVIKLNGGLMFKKRAEALGIRVGSMIEKRSAQFMNGPITIKVGNTNIALGVGMAEKIIVEVL